MNGCSVFPEAPAILEHHYLIVWRRIKDTHWGLGLTPLQRCSRYILQPQLTGPQDTDWGSLAPLQRCSRCILQPQPTGQVELCITFNIGTIVCMQEYRNETEEKSEQLRRKIPIPAVKMNTVDL